MGGSSAESNPPNAKSIDRKKRTYSKPNRRNVPNRDGNLRFHSFGNWDEDGIALATPAIESILNGAEHGTVLHGLEQDRKRMRIQSRSLETYEPEKDRPILSMHWFPGLPMLVVAVNADSSLLKSIQMTRKRSLRC